MTRETGNEVTADPRRAKATFYRNEIRAAKSSADYWKVVSNATKPKIMKNEKLWLFATKKRQT